MCKTHLTLDENETVISINPAVVRMFGYEAGEVVGRNIQMLMPASIRGGDEGCLAHAESTDTTHRYRGAAGARGGDQNRSGPFPWS